MKKIIIIITLCLLSCNDKTVISLPDNGNDDFKAWKSVSGSWTYTNGIFTQDSVGQPPAGLGYQLCTGDSTWKNYSITFDIKSDLMDWAGLFFRYTNQYNFYCFLLRTGNCELGLNSGTERNYSILKTYTSSLKRDTWYSIKANISGNTFLLYVDDVLYFNETNDFFKKGSIAIGGKGVCYFKNMKIEQLP